MQDPLYCRKDCFRRDERHAVALARPSKTSLTVDGRFYNLPQTVKFKLMTVEDIIKEDQFFVQADCDVHRHRDCSDHNVTPRHQTDELY